MANPLPVYLDDSAALKLLDIARQLAVPCDLETVFERVIEAGRQILHADRGSVFLYDPANRELVISVGTGVQELRFSVDQGIAGQCAREGRVINVPDCYADDRFNRSIDLKTGYRTQCLIAVPLEGLDDELVGVMQFLNAQAGTFTAGDERVASALGAQAAVAIQRARLIDERMIKLKLERDLAIARQIQQAVLPHTLPTYPDYDLAAFSQPADETGGDMYDVVTEPAAAGVEHPALMLLLADATGHGVGPAISVTQARALFRMGLRCGVTLADLLGHMNAQLSQDLPSSRFITCFLGRLDMQRHEIIYQSAGQAPLLHYQAAQRRVVWHEATTVPLGILPELPLDHLPPVALAPGDLFVLLTDGFYEGPNPHDERMGNDRIAQAVINAAAGSSAEVLAALLKDLRGFSAGRPPDDDLTALIVKRTS